MVEIILLILLVGLSLFLSRLRTIYTTTPASELSHRSREGDVSARQLHLVAKYGSSINVVFWGATILTSAGTLLIFNTLLKSIWSYVATVLFLLAVFIVIPGSRSSGLWIKIAVRTAPQTAKILNIFHPTAKIINKFWRKFTPAEGKTLSKEEVLAFFDEQRTKQNPLITHQQAESIAKIVRSDNKRIKDVMLPFESTRIVKSTDEIGPILIDELHKTGQGWFPVRQPKKKNIVGFFYIHELLTQTEGGKVGDVMDEELFYVHEKQPLWTVLDAFIQTKTQIYLVINEQQKIVGIVSVEAVLTALLGNLEQSGAESYDDPEAVALY